MSRPAFHHGGIIAAGAGARLLSSVPKPMLPISGVPLIARALGNFVAAGIHDMTIIFKEADRDLAGLVERQFPSLKFHFIIKTTRYSSESFREVVAAIGPGTSLLSVVDSVCLPQDFALFARQAAAFPQPSLVLAVTPFVDDEKPLWVEMDSAGRVTRLGGGSGQCVTAGIYAVPFEILSAGAGSPPPTALRQLLGAWVHEGRPTYSVAIPKLIDVDRPEDIGVAEAFLEESSDPHHLQGRDE